MTIENHALIYEFPELRERIHDLKTRNSRFRSLFEQYDKCDHEVRRIEQGDQAAPESYLEDLKKIRLALKDELYTLLQQAA